MVCSTLNNISSSRADSIQVGGMREEEAVIDVTRAQAMGFDAFALNILSVEEWAIWSIDFLFKAAVSVGFYLFFSLDMLHFSDPSEFIPLIEKYTQNSAYYHYNGLPFVSECNEVHESPYPLSHTDVVIQVLSMVD